MPSTPSTIHIINGPNLDQLGSREPSIYGNTTLADIKHACATEAKKLGMQLAFMQSNAEADIIAALHKAGNTAQAVIINAAGYSHTSVAIADAVRMLSIPIIEVHLSNTQAREEFRHQSHIAPLATGIIAGFGAESYRLALLAAHKILLASATEK